MNFKIDIENRFSRLIEIRRDFHKHPELSNQEFRTQKKILQILEAEGIACQPIAGTGVLGIIQGPKEGPVIALRADIDALPIQEINAVDYASQNANIMHACGHDVHATILLGSAMVLNQHKDELHGSIKLLFQPAEETTGGALPMIQAGVLDHPSVDYAFGLHVMPYLPSGHIEIRSGQMNAASNAIEMTIRGKKSHAAYPDLGTDAIYIASQVITGLQSVVSRSTSPLDSCALTIGTIQGGDKGNILCDQVHLTGTLRTLSENQRTQTKSLIERTARGITEALGGHLDLTIHDGYEALFNDPEVTALVEKVALEHLGQAQVHHKVQPSLGVEDFSYFSNRVPSSFFHLGCQKSPDQNALHQSNFDVDENCIKTGVLIQCEIIHSLIFSQ